MVEYILIIELFASAIPWVSGRVGDTEVRYEIVADGPIKFSPDSFATYQECKRVELAVLKQFVGSVKRAGCLKKN